jgi:hypothetical protein
VTARAASGSWWSEWTKPPILIYFLSLLMAAGGSYLATQKNNDKAVEDMKLDVATLRVEFNTRTILRDQEMAQISRRLDRLEDRRGQ